MLPLHRRLVLGSVAVVACIAAACGDHQTPNALPGLPTNVDTTYQPLSAQQKPKLYAANATGPSVTEYSLTANGNAHPLRTIIGSNTDLHSPNGIAVDSHGFIYVASIGNTPADIDVYRPSANGDAKPVRSIAPKSPHPGLFSSKGLAFDASDNLYVADVSLGILVFAHGASGDVAPIRTIIGSNVRCTNPVGISVDSSNHVWATNTDSVCEYASRANGNAAPIRVITGQATQLFQASDVKINAGGQIFVTDAWPNLNVLVFARNAQGNVAPQHIIVPPSNIPTPAPESLALNGTDLYVDVGSQQSTLEGGIAVYPQSANGSPKPKRLVKGSKTGLSETFYIAIH
jgi:hypothetical protein